MVKTEWALCPIVSKNTKMVVEYGKQRRNNEGGDLHLCPHCYHSALMKYGKSRKLIGHNMRGKKM